MAADPVFIAAATFAFTVIGTAITTTWRLSRMLDKRDNTIITKIAEHELADTIRFASVNAGIQSMGETVRHEFGETGAALRQRMHEMEMWGRDNNLSKSTFGVVTGEIKESIKSIAGKLDSVIMRNSNIDRNRRPT